MTTIGFIDAGHIGSQVARLAVKNGYDVVVSNSRGPESVAGSIHSPRTASPPARPTGARS